MRAISEDPLLSHSDPATGLPVRPRADRVRSPDSHTPEQLLQAVLQSVDDDKAEDIVQIDLRGRSDVADYMVICSGRSSRQVAAISEKLADRLKQAFGGCRRVATTRHGAVSGGATTWRLYGRGFCCR